MVLLPEFDIGIGLKVGEPETTKYSSLAENHMMPGWSIIRWKRSDIRFLHSTTSSSSVCDSPFIIFHWKQGCSISPALLADCNRIKIMPRKLMALRAHLLSLGVFMIVLSYHRIGSCWDRLQISQLFCPLSSLLYIVASQNRKNSITPKIIGWNYLCCGRKISI